MSTKTEKLQLFKYDPASDAKSTFNITEALNENWDKIDEFAKKGSGDSLPLFTPIYSDRVLTGDEAIGFALAGSLVTMVYPQAVENVVNTYNAGEETTYRGVVCKRGADGRFIADISQKSAIDALYASSGVAEFYVLDSVNNQFYLPRNDWFVQGTSDPSQVNQFVEAGLPNITGSFNACFSSGGGVADGAFNILQNNLPSAAGNLYSASKYALDASRSSSLYGKSSTVQPPSSLKLVYYKVGNTVVNESSIDVGQVLSELQLKADIDLSNAVPSQAFKDSSIGWNMPDWSKAVNITALTTFTTTQKCFLYLYANGGSICQYKANLGGEDRLISAWSTTGTASTVEFKLEENTLLTRMIQGYQALIMPMKGN